VLAGSKCREPFTTRVSVYWYFSWNLSRLSTQPSALHGNNFADAFWETRGSIEHFIHVQQRRSHQFNEFTCLVAQRFSLSHGVTYSEDFFFFFLISLGIAWKQLIWPFVLNCTHEEIKNRLNSGNACYHSVHSLLSSRLCPGM
jgi:hypothetical protein